MNQPPTNPSGRSSGRGRPTLASAGLGFGLLVYDLGVVGWFMLNPQAHPFGFSVYAFLAPNLMLYPLMLRLRSYRPDPARASAEAAMPASEMSRFVARKRLAVSLYGAAFVTLIGYILVGSSFFDPRVALGVITLAIALAIVLSAANTALYERALRRIADAAPTAPG